MDSFDGKIVLLTGASGGLGAALNDQLLEKGATVLALDRDSAALGALCNSHVGTHRLMPLVGDITDEKVTEAVAGVVKENYGRLDLLIHNAGVTHFSRFSDSGSQLTRRVMDINFMGSVMLTEAVLPFLQKSKGSIAVLSSVAGFAPLFARSAYSASKHALHGFFESLRGELIEDRVHIMMVCPSFIATQKTTGSDQPGAEQGLARPGSATETAGRALSPDFVASQILRGVQGRKRQLVIGRLARLSWAVSRVFPAFYERQMLKSMRAEVS